MSKRVDQAVKAYKNMDGFRKTADAHERNLNKLVAGMTKDECREYFLATNHYVSDSLEDFMEITKSADARTSN